MFSFLVAGLLTLLLGFIIGWLVAWLILLRMPGVTPGPVWKWVLIGAAAGVLLSFLLIISPWVDLSPVTGSRLAAQPATYTPYPTHTAAPTYTPQPTFTPFPTSTPTHTPTVTPTHTNTPTQTPTSRPTKTPTKESTETPTVAATETPTATTSAGDETANNLPTTGVNPGKTIQMIFIVVLVALLLGAGIWEVRRQSR